jgi:carboxyl-terminal processing protease
MARDLAIWAPSSKRSDILAKLPQFMQDQAKIEDTRIAKSLATRNIDWSTGPAPTAGSEALLQIGLSTDKPNHTIRGGEHGVLTVEVTNTGTAPAYQVRAISESDYSYFDERELMFGKIAPGETKTATLKLSVAAHELSRTDRIDFHVLSEHGAKLAQGSQTSIDVAAQGITRPAFAYGYQIIDDPARVSGSDSISGNGDGLLQVGERVHLRVWVQNSGVGDAQDARVQLRNGSGDAVFLHEGRGKIGELAIGEHAFVDLDFEVQKPTREVDLQLTVNDNKIGEYVTEEIVFPIAQPLSFDSSKQGASTRAAANLYAAPSVDAPALATVDAGQRFTTLGSAGGWYEVEIAKGQLAYARAEDLSVEGSAPRKPGKTTLVYAVSPPRISLTGVPGQTTSETITVSGIASDNEQIRDLYITVYNPSRDLFGAAEKVFYEASPDPTTGRLEFSAEVPLQPGNNIIDVYARENDQVTGVERMWVLRTSGLAEARAAERNFASNGKLSVDTFK